MPHNQTQRVILLAAALCAAASARADTVTTSDGSRLVGKVTKIESGVVTLSTTYAGDLSVKQASIVAISTDQPLQLRLSSGTRITGEVATSEGAVKIAGADGTITTSVDRIAAGWTPGQEDPQVAALRRHWKYNASVDVAGTTGNKTQLGTAAGFGAKLVGPEDSLGFKTSYNRQVTDGEKSADQFKAGIDYTSNFEPRISWFTRDEGGFDRIMDIRFYDTAAFGMGYDFVHSDHTVFTGRLGLAYRYDGYNNPATPSVNSAAADAEFSFDHKFSNSELVMNVTAVPAFNDFANYVATQDSYYQVPLANPSWKLRLGVSNDFNSKPGKGIKKMDTSYYTRLILDWQ